MISILFILLLILIGAYFTWKALSRSEPIPPERLGPRRKIITDNSVVEKTLPRLGRPVINQSPYISNQSQYISSGPSHLSSDFSIDQSNTGSTNQQHFSTSSNYYQSGSSNYKQSQSQIPKPQLQQPSYFQNPHYRKPHSLNPQPFTPQYPPPSNITSKKDQSVQFKIPSPRNIHHTNEINQQTQNGSNSESFTETPRSIVKEPRLVSHERHQPMNEDFIEPTPIFSKKRLYLDESDAQFMDPTPVPFRSAMTDSQAQTPVPKKRKEKHLKEVKASTVKKGRRQNSDTPRPARNGHLKVNGQNVTDSLKRKAGTFTLDSDEELSDGWITKETRLKRQKASNQSSPNNEIKGKLEIKSEGKDKTENGKKRTPLSENHGITIPPPQLSTIATPTGRIKLSSAAVNGAQSGFPITPNPMITEEEMDEKVVQLLKSVSSKSGFKPSEPVSDKPPFFTQIGQTKPEEEKKGFSFENTSNKPIESTPVVNSALVPQLDIKPSNDATTISNKPPFDFTKASTAPSFGTVPDTSTVEAKINVPFPSNFSFAPTSGTISDSKTTQFKQLETKSPEVKSDNIKLFDTKPNASLFGSIPVTESKSTESTTVIPPIQPPQVQQSFSFGSSSTISFGSAPQPSINDSKPTSESKPNASLFSNNLFGTNASVNSNINSTSTTADSKPTSLFNAPEVKASTSLFNPTVSTTDSKASTGFFNPSVSTTDSKSTSLFNPTVITTDSNTNAPDSKTTTPFFAPTDLKTSTFPFGTNSATDTKPLPFSFGSTKTETTTQAPFSFGSSTTANTTESKAATPAPIFGASNTSSSQPIFSGFDSTKSTINAGLESTNITTSKPSFEFGATNSSMKFGSSNVSDTKPTVPQFGASFNTSTSATPQFGASFNTASSTTPQFGTSTNTPTSGFSFGANTGSTPFGNNNNNMNTNDAKTSVSLFGSTSATNQPSLATTQPSFSAQTPSFGFGSNNSTAFGNANDSMNLNHTTTPSTFPNFGGQNTGTSNTAFGSSNNPTNNSFGLNNQPTSSNMFNQPTPATTWGQTTNSNSTPGFQSADFSSTPAASTGFSFNAPNPSFQFNAPQPQQQQPQFNAPNPQSTQSPFNFGAAPTPGGFQFGGQVNANAGMNDMFNSGSSGAVGARKVAQPRGRLKKGNSAVRR